MKYYKSFEEQYKYIKNYSYIGIFGSIWLILSAVIHIAHENIDILSACFIVFGILFINYTCCVLLLYWKVTQYNKTNQPIPKWFRIAATFVLSFYLTFYQLDKKNNDNYRNFLLLDQIRHYILLWIIISIIDFTIIYWAIFKADQIFWALISILITTIILGIDFIIAICICKYKGTNSKLLKTLTIITLQYNNYQLYKKIIDLNIKEISNSKNNKNQTN
ncbi:MAG: hypothetical protein REH79_01240 [Spiroplasma sp.]|nr:hypothetical protein [Spiroplasma sp.]